MIEADPIADAILAEERQAEEQTSSVPRASRESAPLRVQHHLSMVVLDGADALQMDPGSPRYLARLDKILAHVKSLRDAMHEAGWERR